VPIVVTSRVGAGEGQARDEPGGHVDDRAQCTDVQFELPAHSLAKQNARRRARPAREAPFVRRNDADPPPAFSTSSEPRPAVARRFAIALGRARSTPTNQLAQPREFRGVGNFPHRCGRLPTIDDLADGAAAHSSKPTER
jgi:hypothetical protein